MCTIFDVANYFLCQENNNESDITNMKLQKRNRSDPYID